MAKSFGVVLFSCISAIAFATVLGTVSTTVGEVFSEQAIKVHAAVKAISIFFMGSILILRYKFKALGTFLHALIHPFESEKLNPSSFKEPPQDEGIANCPPSSLSGCAASIISVIIFVHFVNAG